MKLKDSSGNEFQLVIVRYQYPDVHEDRWDSNWLIVSGSVVTSAGEKWTFTEPCVTTFELADFADWLDGLSENGRAPSDFEFTEPNVKFAYTPWPQRTLHVTLSHASAPESIPERDRVSGVTLPFPLPEGAATALAVEIRDALADFPIRGGAA